MGLRDDVAKAIRMTEQRAVSKAQGGDDNINWTCAVTIGISRGEYVDGPTLGKEIEDAITAALGGKYTITLLRVSEPR